MPVRLVTLPSRRDCWVGLLFVAWSLEDIFLEDDGRHFFIGLFGGFDAFLGDGLRQSVRKTSSGRLASLVGLQIRVKPQGFIGLV